MKSKPTKLQNLFEGHRRKAFLVAWSHLRTKAGESRIKLDLKLPLLNESVQGINDAIAEAFGVMAKNESKIDRTTLNVEMEGMTLEAFSTAEHRIPAVSSTGVKILKLALVAAGEGEKRTLDLVMVAYVPASVQLRDWAWEHLHKEFHLEAVYSQTEMDFGSGEVGEESESADDEDDAPDEDEDDDKVEPVVAAGARQKSGPRELASFHAKQVN